VAGFGIPDVDDGIRGKVVELVRPEVGRQGARRLLARRLQDPTDLKARLAGVAAMSKEFVAPHRLGQLGRGTGR